MGRFQRAVTPRRARAGSSDACGAIDLSEAILPAFMQLNRFFTGSADSPRFREAPSRLRSPKPCVVHEATTAVRVLPKSGDCRSRRPGDPAPSPPASGVSRGRGPVRTPALLSGGMPPVWLRQLLQQLVAACLEMRGQCVVGRTLPLDALAAGTGREPGVLVSGHVRGRGHARQGNQSRRRPLSRRQRGAQAVDRSGDALRQPPGVSAGYGWPASAAASSGPATSNTSHNATSTASRVAKMSFSSGPNTVPLSKPSGPSRKRMA